MANPWHHAVSSARKNGGAAQDYLAVHQFFDQTKSATGDYRHRAILHNSFGIFLCEQVFGPTITVTVAYRCPACDKRLKVPEDGRITSTCACFKPTVEWVPVTKEIPTRWIGEQHVIEDMGRIIPLNEWIECIQPQPWMNRPVKLSRELEREARRQQEQEVVA